MEKNDSNDVEEKRSRRSNRSPRAKSVERHSSHRDRHRHRDRSRSRDRVRSRSKDRTKRSRRSRRSSASRERSRDREDSPGSRSHRSRRRSRSRSDDVDDDDAPRRKETSPAPPDDDPQSTTENDKKERRKRRTGWDGAPGFAPVSSLSGFSSAATEAPVPCVSPSIVSSDPTGASAIMQSKASMSQLCRIYVGSLDYSLTEADLKQVFSAFGPIANIDMPKEGARSKGFCFIEYASPESAEMSLATMQNFNLKGRPLKVGRPTALGSAQSTAGEPMSAAAAAHLMQTTGASTTLGLHMVADQIGMGSMNNASILTQQQLYGTPPTSAGQHRIYVGSVPYTFTAEDLKSIFQVFGVITSCQLIPSNERPGTHRGYGFIEYAAGDQARIAIDTMNGFEVAGKQLRVNYATALRNVPPATPPMFTATTAPAAMGMTGMGDAMMNSGMMMTYGGIGAGMMNVGPAAGAAMAAAAAINPIAAQQRLAAQYSMPYPQPQQQQQVMQADLQPPAVATASSVAPPSGDLTLSHLLLLTNLVDPNDVDDDLKPEVSQECSKYGVVSDVHIVNEGTVVKIFVSFASPQEAQAAIPALDGRWFAGKVARCRAYDPKLFAARNFDG